MQNQSIDGGEIEIISSYELQRLLANKKTPALQFRSKIPTLDKLTDGFHGGELIMISGPSKHGKSLLGQTLTQNFLDQQIFSLWFSYELSPREFVNRFPKLPLLYLPKQLRTCHLKWLEACIIKSLKENATKAIFIDHLHYLFDVATSKSPSLTIGSIIRFLKQVAVNNEVVIFLISHTGKLDPRKEPDAEDMRDSSFSKQESDCGLIIWRIPHKENGEWVYSNEAVLKVDYHRRTGVLNRKFGLSKIDGLLKETAHE